MFGLGTLINASAVVAGGILGVVLKKGISENYRKILMQACGVSTIFIGVSGVLEKMLVINGNSVEVKARSF